MPEVTNLAKDAERLAQVISTLQDCVRWGVGPSAGTLELTLAQIARLREERDTATRRAEALEAANNDAVAAIDDLIVGEGGNVCWGEVANIAHHLQRVRVIKAAPPAADHTERAREVECADQAHEIMCEAREACGVYHTTAAGKVRRALTAAERAGAEKMRALDEAVIQAAREIYLIDACGSQPGHHEIYELCLALAARDAALKE